MLINFFQQDLHFDFVKGLAECLIVEGGYKTYRHFNFEAIQSGTSISLFFAEVIPWRWRGL